MSTDTTFTTIRSVGGLLPTSLLGRVADLDPSLPGTTPASFGLDGTTRANEPIAPAWNRLKTRWGAFNASLAGLDATDRGTVETREFLLALLGELGLGVTPGSVDVGDDRYPISHVADDYPVPVHLLSTRIDVDRRTKGVEGAATRAPHGLVQELLNRSDDHLWAIVAGGTGMEEGDTDGGLVLRLLRDNQSMTRQAFVEFDLAAMFDGDVYADFVVLWLTLHHTRFAGATPADCLLEQWLNAAEEAGARALDTLRNGVEDAITQLGTGLLRHPSNTQLRQRLQDGEIDAEELYRQLLRVVYRLLFLFVAEDRDLLLTPADEAKPQARERYMRWYSTTRLRAMAREVGGGRHDDLWRQLTRVLHELGSDTGCEELALPPLGGGLFSIEATTDVVGRPDDVTSLSNADLLDAVRHLAWTVDDGVVRSVDFRNLGSEELGSVYESLLELVPRASATGQEFTLETIAGNARKSTGSYYTPSSLIKILLDEALDPLLDEAEAAEAPEAALLSLTVCDPASGSGHFLVAAANRIAERLAAVRSGDTEPSPVQLQRALRDVVSRCIYGVDVNPMAAELAKVTLWLECHVPGLPMTFLDHHIKVGNSLIGVGFDTSIADWNPEGKYVDNRGGIPDAAFEAHTGDEKKAATKYKKRSRDLRDQKRDVGAGQGDLFSVAAETGPSLHDLAAAVDQVDDTTVEGIHTKEQRHRELHNSYAYTAERLKYDAWCAAFTMVKTEQRLEDEQTSPVEIYYRTAAGHDVALEGEGVEAIVAERQRVGFFHWPVEFPQIAERGGFDLLIGNPPWERIKLEEKEWFSNAGRDDVVGAGGAAARKERIRQLGTSSDVGDRLLHRRWIQASHDAESWSAFARGSTRFPLGGVGDVNTYALFADHFVQSVSDRGMMGIIVPTGVVTDYYYRDFFKYLHGSNRLKTVLSLWEIRKFFPGTDHKGQFCLLTASALPNSGTPRFAFGVKDPRRPDYWELTPEDAELLSPLTGSAPAFTNRRQASIVRDVYRRTKSTVVDWRFDYQRMFDVSTDSALFHSERRAGFDPVWVGSMIHNLNPAYQEWGGQDYVPFADRSREPSVAEWIQGPEHVARGSSERDFYVGYRRVSRNTDERTSIVSLVPPGPVANSIVLLLADASTSLQLCAVGSSFAFDFLLRSRLTQATIPQSTFSQVATPDPTTFEDPTPWSPKEVMADWLGCRVAALSAVTPRMAQALGFQSPVAASDADEVSWRAELDAAMFLAFGYSSDEVAFVMDSFPIVARHERREEGLSDTDPNWRSKRLIVDKYEELQRHTEAGTAYESPQPPPPLPEKLRFNQTGAA